MPGDLVNALRSSVRYRRERRGIFTSNIAEAGGFVKSLPGLEAPDLQLHFCIGILESHGRKLHAKRGFSSHVCVLRPKSVGRVSLQSADPFAAPSIDPGYFADPEDVETMVRGFKISRAIMESPVLAPFAARSSSPPAFAAMTRSATCCAGAPTRSIIRSARARWAPTTTQWSIRSCACGASTLARRRCVGDADTDRRKHQCARRS
jgi:choline dehydrogenase-like flavoprotein